MNKRVETDKTNQIDQMNQTDHPTEHAWQIAVTPLRLCRQSASSGWVQFQLRDGVLKTSPFFRNQGEEFDTQAALARPLHDGVADGSSLTQEDSPSSVACLSRS